MTSKKVSIIMGVYNEDETWVKECIDSILNQTHKNFEFIIILDNPNNNELKLLLEAYSKKDDRIKFQINNRNIGLIDTLNKAIELSEGEYIARMDADDIAKNNRIEYQVKFLDENPEYALIGAKLDYIDESGNHIELRDNRPIKYEDIKEYSKYENPFAHPTLMYSSKVIKMLGGYGKALYAEDYDLILRFIVNGYKVSNIDEKLLKYRLRDSGISISKKNYQVTTTQYLQEIYNKFLNENKMYMFDEEKLNKLFRKDNTSFGKFVDSLHKNSLEYGDKGNKVVKFVYILILILLSNKYRKWYKNKLIIRKAT